MNALINSITQVSHARANAQHINAESADTVDEVSIVNAINNISKLSKEFEKHREAKVKEKSDEIIKTFIKLHPLIGKLVIPHKYRDDIRLNKNISILSVLGRENNENLFSDFLATLFKQSVMGDFANQFFRSMLADYPGIGVDHGQLSSIKVSRERRLDSINESLKGEEIGKHRIDLLIETKGYFLLIENKILADESESQTETYHRKVSEVWEKEDDPKRSKGAYYLLSPSGVDSSCKKFESITYMEICKKMVECKGKSKSEPGADEFFNICINEFSQCILKPILKGIENADKYFEERLKENNHEFK